jgi:enoyl-CoA hydratase/carnithine racemase
MSQRLPRRIGMGPAKRLMFTAQPISAAEAQAMGLIDVLVDEGTLAASTAELAAAILANSWHTNIETKRLLRETEGISLAQGLAHENYRNPGYAADHQERMARFSKK